MTEAKAEQIENEINLGENINLDDILKESENFDTTKDDQIDKNINLDDILKESEKFDTTKDDQIVLFLLKDKEKTNQEIQNKNNELNNGMQEIYSTNKNQNIIEQNVLKEKKIQKFKNPIEFVNYIETIYFPKKFGEHSEFYLNNHKFLPNSKNSILQFIAKPKLSSFFFYKGNIITSIAASEDVIFTGNNLGKITMYSCEKEREYKSLSTDELISTNSKRGVLCMDISDNIDYLISGYMNGYIALWELSSSKCKKLIKDQHDTSIIAVKFLKVKNKEYEFLSSDVKGNVKKIIITEGYFYTSVDSINVMTKNPDPVFLIEVLKLSLNEINIFKNNEEKPIIAAFGSIEKIVIYQIEPVPKRLFVFQRPQYFKSNYYIPDVSFGIGYPPRNKTSNNSKKEIFEYELLCNVNVPHRLISISWGKVIYIYYLPFDMQIGAEPPIFLGHYVNKSPILRMGFIANSFIFIFDMYKKFKVINTGLLTPGELKLEHDDSPIAQVNEENPPELEKEKEIDQEILFQTFIPDKGSRISKSGKATYNNFIISKMKTLYILGKKQFHYGKLLNWEQYINIISQNSQWMDALALGLDIYHGRNVTLVDIPISEKERKRTVVFVLKGLILQYTIMTTRNDPLKVKREEYEKIINNCINICIEFCLEINDINYLMEQIQPIFAMKGFSELFIEKLEPFILCDKMLGMKLGNKMVNKLKDLYIKKNKIDIFEQMLTHLDIDSIDCQDIKSLCVDNKLLSSLVYIYMNNKEENYFYPLKIIYDIFIKAENIKAFVSYEKMIEEEKIDNIRKSREYLGHKLFWYINICLKGEKFITKEKIQEKLYSDLVQKILLWILKDNILETLITFDSMTFFDIITKMFTEENIYKYFINTVFQNEQVKDIMLNEKQINRLQFDIIITILIEKCKKINKSIILQDLYEFTTKNAIIHSQIEKNVILESAKYLLGYSSRREEYNKEENEFGFHLIKYNESSYIQNISNDIIAMITSRKSEIKPEEIKELLNIITENNPFIFVKIFLSNLIGDYTTCLDIYILENNIENRAIKTFEFIESTLKYLKETQNTQKTEEFKSSIIARLNHLSILSIPDLVKLVNTSFNDQHMTILPHLKDYKDLQLQYVECVLTKYKEDTLPNDQRELSAYITLLNFHIDLLIELNLIDRILPNLKKRQSYPLDVTLSKCLKASAIDASIYLYKSIGSLTEAFNLSISVLKEILDQLIKCIEESKQQELTNLLKKHSDNVLRCIAICEANSDNNPLNETEKFWFNLLQILYDISDKIKEEKKDKGKEIEQLYIEFNVIISDNIKELLEKMYSYVGMKQIISKVTVKYKQAELKEFKAILIQMVSSYSFLRNIMQNAKNLLSKSVYAKIEKFNNAIIKGNHYFLLKCDKCNSEFNKLNEKICLFRCGHKIHFKCCIEDIDDVICPICRNFTNKISVISTKEKDSIVNIVKNKNDVNNEGNEENEAIIQLRKENQMNVKKKNNKKSNFEKLNYIDNFFLKNDFFYYKEKMNGNDSYFEHFN